MEKKTENRIRRAFAAKEQVKEQSVNNMILLARTHWNENIRKENIHFSRFLLAQVRYIGWKIWIIELVVTIIPVFILFKFLEWHTITQTTAVFLLCCLTIAISMLCIPFIYRSIYYQMYEIEAATFFSIKKLLLSRIMILSVGELVGIIGVGIVMSYNTPVDFRNSMVCMLFLFGAVWNGVLRLVRKVEMEKLCRYFLAYGFGLLFVMTMLVRFQQHAFDGTFYTEIFLGSCIFLGYGVYQGRLLARWSEDVCCVRA